MVSHALDTLAMATLFPQGKHNRFKPLLAQRELALNAWFDDIPMVAPARRAELLETLRTRTGLDIWRVDLRQVDFIRDSARLTLYYSPE